MSNPQDQNNQGRSDKEKNSTEQRPDRDNLNDRNPKDHNNQRR